MKISPGTRLGRYEIRSHLGAGGMGEVYLAQDTQLDRAIALKILPSNVASDHQRMHRFVQEAKTAAALNHPNIAHIYEIGEADGTNFIAMEFIDGETLRQHLASARMKLGEVLDASIQVASALSGAHAAGIVHRDIKPENIMLRTDGYVKVLDFGLAKLTERQALTTDTEAPTMARVDTDPGTVLGTANYMSPEQARGLKVDTRTDIFSLGVVVYEMIAGRGPFEGESASEIIAAILDREPPPLARYSREAPEAIEWIVAKALRKDREERYQTAKELLSDLRGLKQRLEFQAEMERSTSPDATGPAMPATSGRRAAETAKQIGIQTEGARAIRTTSSAEYIVNQIKGHKLGAVITVVALASIAILVVTISSRYFGSADKAPIDSIAVLPFVNASNDPDADYLSDGITESLINSLSQLPHIKVIARSSVFRYKGKETDPQTAAKELNVQALISGRVAQRGDSLTISVELVDARDNTHLWGQQFTRKTSDIFALQEEIARQVLENLRVKLSRADEERVTKRYTADEEAYKLYLLGRSYWNRRTGESLRKAIEYFNQAIAKDPSYALAYAGLADTYTVLPAYGVGQPKETNRKARAAALRALELDNTLADPHAALATILAFSDWNWSAAENEFKRAIALNSNYATAHEWYAEFLLNVGRMEEGIAESKRAQELDPLSLIISRELGTNLFFAKQYDAAMVQLQKTLAMDANFVPACIDLGFVYERKGMYEQAIPMFQKAISLEGDNTFALSGLGYTYARWGKKKEALAALERMMEFTKQKYVSANEVATIYVGLGEVDKAFEWLERGYAEHDDFLAFLKVHPPFDSIRSDPRFVDLMRRVGLPR